MSLSEARLRPSSASVAPPPAAAPRPILGLRDAVGIIVGIIIGAGIFKTPALVASNVDGIATLVLAWVAGGIVSLTGALCYAELASAYPDAGGDYHFLHRAYGRRVSFLFAWARLTVIQTGSVALLAFVLGDYASAIAPLGGHSTAIYAAVVVAGLTLLHIAGAAKAALAQNVLTVVEVLGVVLVIVVGLAWPAAPSVVRAVAVTPAGFGLVMVFVLLTYGGWNEASYVSAEVRDPGRNMARSLVLSLLIVTALYVLVNVALVRGLGLDGLAASSAPAADLLNRVAGRGTAVLVSLMVVISTFTSINACIFTGARSAYAVGRDFRPFRLLGHWHGARQTPVNALVVQAVIALALILIGAVTRRGFETMVEYTAPVFWAFILLAGAALFILRRREPRRPRPFRAPLYPLTPLVFCATCAYLLYSSLAYTGLGALLGVSVVAAGAVVLVVTSRAGSWRS
ncbi:MAG TPA: APC family permease [Methylomirabilota bacterium]|nr:APC family permease [Methylomirabilota bacterium]